MKTLVVDGVVIEIVTPESGLLSGQPIVIQDLVGISTNTYLAGETAVVMILGVHIVPKEAEQWQPGQRLFWNKDKKTFTTVSGTNIPAGYAWSSSSESASTGAILLR